MIPMVLFTAVTWTSGCAAQPDAAQEAARIGAVLDSLHDAASKADEVRYFEQFAPGATFLGTDASERWALEEFRAYAAARFKRGTAWTYIPRERHVDLAPGGRSAWFDELLDNAKYGRCRGTGVLVRTPRGWKVAQYHLTIPIPNELAPEVVERIR
jgi:hypothetical protein